MDFTREFNHDINTDKHQVGLYLSQSFLVYSFDVRYVSCVRDVLSVGESTLNNVSRLLSMSFVL